MGGEQSTEQPNPADHLKPYRFKPGQSGNPNGTPNKGPTLTTRIRTLLREENGGETKAQALIRKAYEMAMDGDFRYFKEILERMDGKVAEQVLTEMIVRAPTRVSVEDAVEAKRISDERKQIEGSDDEES